MKREMFEEVSSTKKGEEILFLCVLMSRESPKSFGALYGT